MARITVISIPVRDQSAAARFYQDVLGFRLLRDTTMSNGPRWVQLAPDEGLTTITLVTWFETMPAGSIRGVVLETNNIDSDCQHLKQRNLQLSEIKHAPWGKYATFEDIDGNGWVLQQTATNT